MILAYFICFCYTDFGLDIFIANLYFGNGFLFVPFLFQSRSWCLRSHWPFLFLFFSLALWNKGNAIIGHNRASIFVNLFPVYSAILAYFSR